MRALDGTYWRVYWKPNPTECSLCLRIPKVDKKCAGYE